jgi:hypothetical protein
MSVTHSACAALPITNAIEQALNLARIDHFFTLLDSQLGCSFKLLALASLRWPAIQPRQIRIDIPEFVLDSPTHLPVTHR